LPLVQRAAPSEALSTLNTLDYHALAFSPTDSNVVFFGHHNGVMRSEDGGRTRKALVDRPNFDALNLSVSRSSPKMLYLAGHDVLQLSSDGGTTWHAVANNLPGLDLHAFSVDPTNSNRLHAFAVGFGVFNSEDGGRTWLRVAEPDMPVDVTSLASAGGSPETVYLASLRPGILRSTDGGRTWPPLSGDVEWRQVFAIATDPSDSATLYAGADGGLYKSSDSGTSWSQLLFPVRTAVTVAVNPLNPADVLPVGTKGRQGFMYRSLDGGVSWGQ
jgi:hypothetical protein